MEDKNALGLFNDWISTNELPSNINTCFNALLDESHPPPTITVEFMLAEKHPTALVK